MKKIAYIFLLVFYSFGTFCLPMGDFSALQDIPEMYRQCKATEDKDMSPFDFITDHLINIDGLFDRHENGDEQKPHTPGQAQHHAQTQVFFVTYFTFSVIQIYPTQNKPSIYSVSFLPSDYITKIFHPPIV